MIFSKYFDHTLLKADATQSQIQQLCREALDCNFKSVCIHPFYVASCSEILNNTGVMVCTVVGFPFGANLAETKQQETKLACREGAQEIDMVINIGALKSGLPDVVFEDISDVVETAHRAQAHVKCILETGLLTGEEKVLAATLAKEAGADYVKTSTGVLAGGATVEDVALLRKTVGDTMGVKASGGIKDYSTAMDMINQGASRIGASASVKILEEYVNKAKD